MDVKCKRIIYFNVIIKFGRYLAIQVLFSVKLYTDIDQFFTFMIIMVFGLSEAKGQTTDDIKPQIIR